MTKSSDKPDVYGELSGLYLCDCKNCGDPGPCRRWAVDKNCKLCTGCLIKGCFKTKWRWRWWFTRSKKSGSGWERLD
jgi:hypothetical protein